MKNASWNVRTARPRERLHAERANRAQGADRESGPSWLRQTVTIRLPPHLRRLGATRWVIGFPGGRVLRMSSLPERINCGVCGAFVKLTGATGRIACHHCKAHVVNVERRSVAA